ncbi:MAG: RsmG family class I SAM-dependent methyltransferase [Acidimicrobiia bacterium]
MNLSVEAAFRFVNIPLDDRKRLQLTELAAWLRGEAIFAGAVGPLEDLRLEDRHLADSIVFAAGWDEPPGECWDLGSGIGLPGLVLAVVWPATRLILIDRSIRRLDLARRAARIIGVSVETRLADIRSMEGSVEAIVSRAAVPAWRLAPHLRRTLKPGGLAVVSGSGDPPPGFETMEIPPGVLDHEGRLLIMHAQ